VLKNLSRENPGDLLDGIIWQDGYIESKGKARTAAVDCCLYLLHELPASESARLLGVLKDITKPPWTELPPRAKLPK